VVTAIDGLGPEYAPVRKLIIGALQEMLQDVPSLPNATLMDDSPTANRQTSNWMEEEGLFLADGGGETKARRASEGPAQLLKQAQSRARDGRTQEAVGLLLQAAEEAHHEREGFLTRSEAAALMVDHGLEAVARPILDDMMGLIEQHGLDRWESGEIVARPLGLLYRIRTAAGEGADDLYERIVRLDPVHALELKAAEQAAAAAQEVTEDGAAEGQA
jgi:type VI secretion system protein ImpA